VAVGVAMHVSAAQLVAVGGGFTPGCFIYKVCINGVVIRIQ
jgi:hypothetical protein